METAGYTTLTRQNGLLREIQTIANNIANASTTGFRQEGLIFSEYVVGSGDGPSVSMASADVRHTSLSQGPLTPTGGQLDFAIEGEGFFLIETPAGQRLTRSGGFSVSGTGDLVTLDGHRVLDAGGAPIFIPPDVDQLGLSEDGALSADGRLLGQLGVVQPVNRFDLLREGGVMFRSESPLEPVEGSRVLQGHLEGANVNVMLQFARMLEVQRAYEMGQSFLDAENERVRDALRTFTRR